MNNCCLSLVIRQRACQNGVPVVTEQVFSNISEGETISLNFGYTVILSFYGSNNILITFNNTSLNVSLRFAISNPGVGVFDIPIDGGTFRVVIATQSSCCNTALSY